MGPLGLGLGLWPRNRLGGGGAPAPTPSPTLSAMETTLDGGNTTYPPTLDYAFFGDHIVGDEVRMQTATDYAFTTPIINDVSATLTGTYATDKAALNALLAGISSPAVTFIRARVERSASVFGEWSISALHGSAVAPSLTSSATLAVTSGQLLAETITTDVPCYCTIEGDDGLNFEIIGAQPATSFTLRKLNNGTFDDTAPEDFDQDNIHDVTLVLTGLNEAEADEAVTVEVEALTLTVGTFTAQTGVAQSTLTESNEIEITALNVPSVTVEASGLEYQKNGGAWTSAAGTATLNDTFKARLTSSASYLTLASGTLTFNGTVDRDFDVTTLADPAAATYSHGDVISVAGGGATASFTSLTFEDGLAFVMLQAPISGPSTTVTLDSNAMTLRHREASPSGALELYTLPVAAGSSHALAVTYAAFNAGRVLAYGTVVDGAFVSAAGSAPANEDNPHLTPSATVPAGGFAIAGFQEYGAAPITPATANSGTTFIDEGNVEVFGEALGIALGSRSTTGTASFNYVFGTFARVIAVFEPA